MDIDEIREYVAAYWKEIEDISSGGATYAICEDMCRFNVLLDRIDAMTEVVDAAKMLLTVQSDIPSGHWRLERLRKSVAKLND